MPPLVAVEIPVFSPSPPRSTSSRDDRKGKAPSNSISAQRNSHIGPLSYRLDEKSPRNAQIVGRVIENAGAFYHIKIGEVEINDVGIDEILDYVSAEQIEEYELQQFEQEAEMERIIEADEARRKAEKLLRMKARAKTKGTVIRLEYDEAQDARGEAAAESHGRARPTYKHLFKKSLVRRRRKRDPETGELMPLSDDDEDLSDTEPTARSQASRPIDVLQAIKGPRRRKRDPETGELLPLSEPVIGDGKHKKRRRRRRHPITGELMPFGWRYDPTAEGKPEDANINTAMAGNMSPAMKRLSISQDNGAKRIKIAHETLAESSDAIAQREGAIVTESDADDTDDGVVPGAPTSPLKSPPSLNRGQITRPPVLQPAAMSPVRGASPKRNTMTSMIQPVVAATSAEPSEDDEANDGEWVIEAILAHKLSDPSTHSTSLTKKPVMLYQVKWEGFDKPTWEPVESFPDGSVVDDYLTLIKSHKSARGAIIESIKEEDQEQEEVALAIDSRHYFRPTLPPFPTSGPLEAREASSNDEDESEDEDDDDGYEVEAITGHHMSDPRTHGPDFGKEPVMLYQVKWKGYKGHTWEPIDSFVDDDAVHQYRRDVGLPSLEGMADRAA